jgi:hypothetical protein
MSVIKLQILRKLFKSSTISRIIRKYRFFLFRRFGRFRKVSAFSDFLLLSESELVVLGNPVMSTHEWAEKKAIEISKRRQQVPSYKLNRVRVELKNRITSGALPHYEISVIVSIYRPGLLLDSLLGNIYEQTIFNRSEVILVLVEPLDSEIEELRIFSSENSNVTLQIVDSRISIYEAWNLAVKASTAPLITNMNVDDLRSHDSLETQVSFMKLHPWTDVGYQDFYFMLDRDLDWASVQNVGARSQLNAVTLTDLAWFGINPPHNGPVWRRDLHTRFGLFEESLQSAGDYEFWMRIASAKAIFMKMSKSTVGYFVNPLGMSTSKGSPSTLEELSLQERYRKKIGLRSEVRPAIGLDDDFAQNPWDASEVFTEMVLNKLKEVK